VLGFASGAAARGGDPVAADAIEMTVDLGRPGKYEFTPKQLRLETGQCFTS